MFQLHCKLNGRVRKVHELHKKRPELLKEYNINDAVLLRELDTKLSIIPLMIQECDWTGSFLNKFYIGELLDNYILREARREHKILGSRPSEKRKKELENMKIIGGYVMPPVKGMYKDVHVCDFKSLYPSIIVGWNIGMDSLDSNLTDKGQNEVSVLQNHLQEVFSVEPFSLSNLEKVMRNLLFSSLSYCDTVSENLYHCFCVGCLKAALDLPKWCVKTDRGPGVSRYDIVVVVESAKRVIVIELKEATSEANLDAEAEKALLQACEKDYAAEFKGYKCYLIASCYWCGFLSKDNV